MAMLEITHDVKVEDNSIVVHEVGVTGQWSAIKRENQKLKDAGYRWNGTKAVWYKRYPVTSESSKKDIAATLSEMGVPESKLACINSAGIYHATAEITASNGSLRVTFDSRVSEHYTEIPAVLKALRYKYDSTTKSWVNDAPTLDLLNSTIDRLKSISNLKVKNLAGGYFLKQRQERMRLMKEIQSEMPFLLPFQVEGVVMALTKERGLCFVWDMGTGKTAAGLAVAQALHRRDPDLKVIAVVPSSLIDEWVDEYNKFSFKVPYQIVRGTPHRRVSAWERPAPLNIVSYEALREDIGKERFYPTFRYALILDEASKIKNRKTKTSKVIKALARDSQLTVALTGTPLENSLFEYYNILNTIHPGFIPWKVFEQTFCVRENIRVGRNKYRSVITGFKNLTEFARMISPIVHRVRKHEVAPYLPKKTWRYRFIMPTKEQVALHDSLISIAKEKGKGLAGVFQLLRILSDGVEFLRMSDSPTVKLLPQKLLKASTNPKIDELNHLLDEIGNSQVIIFTQFEKVAERLYSIVRKRGSTALITGSTRNAQRTEIKHKVNAGEIQYLVCDDVLAYGANFPDVDFLINYDIPPNPAVLRQRADRIHRISSSTPKTIISLVGGGVERRIYRIIKEKTRMFVEAVETADRSKVSKLDIIRELEKEYGFER